MESERFISKDRRDRPDRSRPLGMTVSDRSNTRGDEIEKTGDLPNTRGERIEKNDLIIRTLVVIRS